MKKNKTKLAYLASFFSVALCLCFFMNFTTEIEGASIAPSISASSDIENPSILENAQESSSSEVAGATENNSSASNSASDSTAESSAVSSNESDLNNESDSSESDISDDSSSSISEENELEEFEEVTPLVDENNLIRVSSFKELSSVLSGTKQDGVIVFTEDIVSTSGIIVNSTWTDIVIDGKDPTTGELHTYTEFKSNANLNAIFINNTSTQNVTLRNMTITGYNYYGTVCVYQSSPSVTLSYENINYTGPQLTYNPGGTARYIDSNIVLIKPSTGTAPQEVAEVNKVELGGVTTITNSVSTSYPIFNLLKTNTSITVLSGADVNITSTNYLFTGPTAGTSFEVQDNASFSLTSVNGLNKSGNSYPISDLVVGENASFQSVSTGTTNQPSAVVKNSVTVKSNGTLILRQKSGAGRGIYFTGATSAFVLESPKLVMIEVNGSSTATTSGVIQTGGNTALQINSQAINTWGTLSSTITDGMDSIPTNIWNQQDGSEFAISGVLSKSKTINSFSTTWQGQQNQWSDALNTSNFDLWTMKAVAFGNFTLDVPDPLYPNTKSVAGNANANAQVGVFYNSTQSTGVAGSSGSFAVPVDFSALAVGDSISVMTSHSLLKAYKSYTLVKLGELKFLSVPSEMPFTGGTIPSSPTYLSRQNANWEISVEDTRGEGNAWRLDATVVGNISDGGSNVLDATLNFVTPSSSVALGSTPTTIYSGTTGTSPTTAISWQADQGVLLWLNSISNVIPNISYSTTIDWSLVDAP